VDDEKDIVETIQFNLEANGFECSVSYDGHDAYKKAKAEKPDLILLDIMLPSLDGYKVCRLLKFDDKYKHIPIVMLTVRGKEKDQLLGMETGADEYITKPFDIDDLLIRVSKYVSHDPSDEESRAQV
jgi:DNA-binding response OmpR family regulator